MLIRKSKHLTYVALLVGLGVVVTKMVDFQFSSVASQAITDPDELTVFFGFWFSTFNVVSLLIQLFLTRKIVGTYGVGTSLYVLPGGILLGSVLLFFSPMLWAGIFTKLWDVSVRQSINKAATELLILPIPAHIKGKTKSFIDVFVDMAATGIGGILLIIVVNGLELSNTAVSVLTIVLVGVWIWVVLKVRREYLNSFKSKLTQADKENHKPLPDFSKDSVIDGLKRALDNGTENQILYVLSKVQEVNDPRLYQNVTDHLTHPSATVRAAALECIYHLRINVEPDLLKTLISDPHFDVRINAFSQFFSQNKENRAQLIDEYLEDQDPSIKNAVLVSLTEEFRNSAEMISLYRLEEHVAQLLKYISGIQDADQQLDYKTMALRAIGNAQLSTYYSVIYELMDDPDVRVVNEAISAAGLTMYQNFIPRLVGFLETKQTRAKATDALLFYGVGVIDELKNLVFDHRTHPETSRKVPSILKMIDSQKAIDVLLEFLDRPDVMLRLETLRALNTIQQTFPHLKIKKEDVVGHIYDETHLYKEILGIFYLQNRQAEGEESESIKMARTNLTALLERRMDGTIERIFRLLGLSYPPDDVIPVYQGIKSVNPQERLDSVEFLDNLLEPTLKRTLIPIAETAILDSVSTETLGNLKVKLKEEKECLELLLQGRDPKLKSAVFHLIAELNQKDYLQLVQPHVDSPIPKIREQARRLVTQLSSEN